MTTTEEVPMPAIIAYRHTVRFQSEPGRIDTFIFPIDEHPKPAGAEDVCTLADAIAYADARCAALRAERDALAEKVKAMEDSARRALKCLREEVLPLEQDSISIINSTIIDLQSVLYATPVDAAIDAASGDPC